MGPGQGPGSQPSMPRAQAGVGVGGGGRTFNRRRSMCYDQRVIVATGLGPFKLKGIQEEVELFHCRFLDDVSPSIPSTLPSTPTGSLSFSCPVPSSHCQDTPRTATLHHNLLFGMDTNSRTHSYCSTPPSDSGSGIKKLFRPHHQQLQQHHHHHHQQQVAGMVPALMSLGQGASCLSQAHNKHDGASMVTGAGLPPRPPSRLSQMMGQGTVGQLGQQQLQQKQQQQQQQQ